MASKISRLIAAWALAACLAGAASAQTLSVGEVAANQLAVDRGWQIYAYDQAAWHGTDDLMAKAQAAGTWETLAPRGGGWVVDGPADTPELVFFDRDEENPHALYVARFADGGTRLVESRFVSPDDTAAITPERRRMIAALRTAREALVQGNVRLCANSRPNTVVLPPQTPGGPIQVYFLTPEVDSGVYPMGGHYRVEIGADGKAGEIHRFANSCLTVSRSQAPEGSTQVGMVVTHLLDPTPTEIHVFTMLAARMPIYVATTSNNRLWVVQSPRGRPTITLASADGD